MTAVKSGFQMWHCNLPRASKAGDFPSVGLCPFLCKKKVWTRCPEVLSSSEMLRSEVQGGQVRILKQELSAPATPAPSRARKLTEQEDP